eukprot:9597508-Alexandrium_andersonii.AAC.1
MCRIRGRQQEAIRLIGHFTESFAHVDSTQVGWQVCAMGCLRSCAAAGGGVRVGARVGMRCGVRVGAWVGVR